MRTTSSARLSAARTSTARSPSTCLWKKIERALAAVEKAGVRLQIVFSRRFDRNFRRAYEAIQAGEIGKPLMIRITNRDATPPPEAYIKVSGGMLLEMSIHDFDLCRYFAGSEAESVYCTGACNLVPYIGANGDVDTAVTVINFKNGCTAVVDNSRQTGYGMECRVEIMGTEGNLVTGNEVENTLTICEDNGLKQDGLVCDFFARFKNSFPVILGTFLDSIRNNTPTVTTGRDGLETMRIGFAATSCSAARTPCANTCTPSRAAA